VPPPHERGELVSGTIVDWPRSRPEAARPATAKARQTKYLAPRLAGQAQAYLANQLTAFETGERRDSTGAMASVAAALSNGDIPAMAHYLSRLSPGHGDIKDR